MTCLFIDTESTRWRRNGPRMQEDQARVCQLAFIFTDEQGKTLAEFCALIQPDGWVISEGAAKVHHFTQQDCEDYGVPMKKVMEVLLDYIARADTIVAHGEEFDRKMIDIEYAYKMDSENHLLMQPWHCTMKSYTQYFEGKWPKLAEALKFFTGRELGEDAHDAMHDARACRDIFFAARAKEAA